MVSTPGHFRTPPHSMAAQAVAQSAANAQESLTCVKCLVQLVRARASRFAAARLHGADEARVSTGGAPDRGPPRLVPRRGVQASRDCWPAERHGAEGASRWPVAASAALLTSPLRNRCGPHFGAHRRTFRRKRARFATGLTEVRFERGSGPSTLGICQPLLAWPCHPAAVRRQLGRPRVAELVACRSDFLSAHAFGTRRRCALRGVRERR